MSKVDYRSFKKIDEGFRIEETEDYVIEVHRMLFNWRLVIMPPNQQIIIWHGYCYFGLGHNSLDAALEAGSNWKDPMNTEPEGFDKKAF